MKKLILFAIILVLISGCKPKKSCEQAVIKVDDYTMCAPELDEEFIQAKAIRRETLGSKDQFIQEIITRKVMLQEAQREGIDKEREFVKSVERFWEQSLLTILLERKSRQIASKVKISDKEIADYYNKLPEDQKVTPLSDLKPQIELLLRREKESKTLDDWIKSLKKKAHIEINGSVVPSQLELE